MISLQEVVDYLQRNKEEIMARYLDGEQPRLTREEIEQFELMDFDISISRSAVFLRTLYSQTRADWVLFRRDAVPTAIG